MEGAAAADHQLNLRTLAPTNTRTHVPALLPLLPPNTHKHKHTNTAAANNAHSLVDVVLAHRVLDVARLLRLGPHAVELVDLDGDVAQAGEVKGLILRENTCVCVVCTVLVRGRRRGR